jgi:hypothetical protein
MYRYPSQEKIPDAKTTALIVFFYFAQPTSSSGADTSSELLKQGLYDVSSKTPYPNPAYPTIPHSALPL